MIAGDVIFIFLSPKPSFNQKTNHQVITPSIVGFPNSPSTEHNQNKSVRLSRDHKLWLYQGRAYENQKYQKLKKQNGQLATS